MSAGVIALIVIIVFVLFVAASGVRIVPQARAGVVERLGRFQRTLDPGLTLIVPFIDRVKPLIDLREQVVSFPPQPVITEDNLVVRIDTVIYFTVTDPRAATYEVANPLQAIEQLTVTTLRNAIGGMTLEETLTSRDTVNGQLRAVLDEATGRWGIRVARVELKRSSRRAPCRRRWRSRCAPSATAAPRSSRRRASSGAQILTAEGEKQSAVLRAEGARTAAILKAEGEAKAIETVFNAIHEGAPDQALLAVQYLQTLPQLAQGDANKIWIIPSEFATRPVVEHHGAARGAPPSRSGRRARPPWREIDERARKDAEEAARAAAAASAGGRERDLPRRRHAGAARDRARDSRLPGAAGAGRGDLSVLIEGRHSP